MARTLTTISSGMIFALLLVHAVLLPALFHGLFTIVRNGHEEAFIDHTRIYTRVFADIFETSIVQETEAEIVAHLDSAVLGGRSIYATLQVADSLLISSLMESEDADKFTEDFAFGEHGDNVYFLSVPLEMAATVAVLKLGFDEEPTLLQIGDARQTLIYILLMYLLVSLALVVLLSTVLARPLKRLRRDSRKIASGDYTRKLSIESGFHEIKELSDDLETMRSTLVGVNARLQKEIVEREAAVAKQQDLEESLRHSQRLKSIGTLAGGVAHEFNNVLLPILMYAELSLEDLPADSSVRSKLEQILKLAKRAQGLSQQILTFGRQPGDTAKVPLDIVPVVEEAMSMVRALIPASIDIRVDVEKGIGHVLCDAAEIQQLVVNLCSNAYKSQRSGGGLISVSVAKINVDRKFTEKHPKLRQGKHVLLKVTDTGEGMDSATIDRIFEPFFTTREVGKGTGLGLSVVHGIVVKHGGEIVVTSEPNRGATFDVYFPLTEMQALPDIEETKK